MAIWALIIFLLSQDPRSGHHINEILRWVFGMIGLHRVSDFRLWQFLAAKSAHFTVYFVLALVVYRALALGRGARFHSRAAWGTLAFIFCYAALDELHQSFVHGRGGQWYDVVLDTFGGAVALTLIRWTWMAWERRHQQSKPEHVSA